MSRPLSRRRPVTFRPQLEELEGRLVPNASRVLDTYGNLHLFVVRAFVPGANYGPLTRYDKEGATAWFSGGVRWVQAYLDPAGQLGVNVLFPVPGGTRWVVYDSAGSHDMGTGPIGSVSTAFDPAGQKILDISQSPGGNRSTAWYQYDAAGAHFMEGGVGVYPLGGGGYHIVAYNASTAIDRAGDRVTDLVEAAFTDPGGSSLAVPDGYYAAWREVNPSGTFQKSTGQVAQGGEYVSKEQGVAWVMPSFDASGALVYDILRPPIPGTQDGIYEWDYYDAQGAHFMGTDVAW
jgi:hypothetical protein